MAAIAGGAMLVCAQEAQGALCVDCTLCPFPLEPFRKREVPVSSLTCDEVDIDGILDKKGWFGIPLPAGPPSPAFCVLEKVGKCPSLLWVEDYRKVYDDPNKEDIYRLRTDFAGAGTRKFHRWDDPNDPNSNPDVMDTWEHI